MRLLLLASLVCQSATAQFAERPRASRTVDTSVLAGQPLPTGMSITPTVAPGAQFFQLTPNPASPNGTVSGQPVALEISPDGNTLLILTTGYNGTEYVFVYDVSTGIPMFK